ncbi:MAG TPA: HlyD family efflux transporter periplasmic adaptor subunit [Stellaceae bacterium]|nr:HlyD family efflux transporter periplasmic adaptor subunit [Stellaceae bacterium]
MTGGEATRPPRLFSGLLYGVAGVLVLGIGWMAVAPALPPPTAAGAVLPPVATQRVVSPEAGRATATLVREGTIVNPGDLLVRLRSGTLPSVDPGRLERRFQLVATIVRLQASVSGDAPIFPVDLAAERPTLVERETARLAAQTDAQQRLIADLQGDLTRQRLALTGIRDQGHAVEKRLALLNQSLAGDRPLRPLDLARATSDVGMAVDEVAARSAAVEGAMAAAAARIVEIRRASRQRALVELDRRRVELADVEALIAAERDRTPPLEIRAPIRGVVRRLWPGGSGVGSGVGSVPPSAVAAGAPLMEIVPPPDELVIETRMAPDEAAGIKPGQAARVRITSPQAAAAGILPATVEQVGPEDGSGVPVRARLTAAPLVTPGMTATVEVLTDRSTILSGLLRPGIEAATRDQPPIPQISSLPGAGATAGD